MDGVVAERCIDAITVENEQLTYTTLTVRSKDEKKIWICAEVIG